MLFAQLYNGENMGIGNSVHKNILWGFVKSYMSLQYNIHAREAYTILVCTYQEFSKYFS